MLAELKWLIDLFRASVSPIDPKQIQVPMTSLRYGLEQLERIFSNAQQAANEATLITEEHERALFNNWLNYQEQYLNAGRNALHTILDFYKDQKEITQAELRIAFDSLKNLLKASTAKYNEIIDSTGVPYGAGRSLIESYLNQFINALEAPRQQTSLVIPEDVDEQFAAALATIQSDIDSKLRKRVDRGKRPYSCFLSYAWGNVAHEAIVAHVAKLLEAVGIKVHFDRWVDVPGKKIQDFVAKIDSSDWVIIFGSQLYEQKYERRAMSAVDQEHTVRVEAQIMNKIAMSGTKCAKTVIPVLLDGNSQALLPQTLLSDRIAIDLSEGDYVAHVIRLIKTLYKLPADGVSLQKPTTVRERVASSSTAASSSAVASSSSAAIRSSLSDVMAYSTGVRMFGRGTQMSLAPRRSLLSSTEGNVTDRSLWNVPDLDSNYQVRLSYSQKIENALSGEGQCVISQTSAGSGGVGKTQLALNYVHQNSGKYAFVQFILAESWVGQVEPVQMQQDSPQGLEHQYCHFARALGVDTQNNITIIREDVKKRLALSLVEGKRALVIFDNVDDKKALDLFLADLQSLEMLDILITTRDPSGAWENSIRVDVYEPFEAVSYVCRRLVKENQFNLMEEPLFDLIDAPLKEFCQEHQSAILNDTLDWRTILASGSETRLQLVYDFVEALDCYPMSLTHALAYCLEDEMKLSTYLQKFRDCMKEVIPGLEKYDQSELGSNNNFLQEILNDQYGTTIYIAFKFIFDKLLQDCSEASGTAKQIALATLKTLGSLAYLSPDAIPEKLLESVIRAQLIAADKGVARPRDRTVRRVLQQLVKFGILHGSNKTNDYYTHRLVQSVVQFFWEEVLPDKSLGYLPDQRGLVSLLVGCVNDDFPGDLQRDGNSHRKALISYIPHLEVLHNACSSLDMTRMVETVQLQSDLGFLYHLNGEEKKARLSQESALSMLEKVECADKTPLADKVVARCARALMELNQYRLAKEALLAQFPGVKEGQGVSLLAQVCFADLLCRMHNQEEARRVIELFLKNLASPAQSSSSPVRVDESYVQARLYYQLAKLNHHFGEHQEAKENVGKALENKVWDNELLLADCYLLLAKVNTVLKAYAEAIVSGDKAMAYAEAFYGAGHIQVGHYLVRYARQLIDTPDRDSRFRVVERAKRLLQRLIQQGDARAAHHLAWAYEQGVFVEYTEVLSKKFAFRLYKNAASSGDHTAQLQLAKLYLSGKGEARRLTCYAREDKAYQLLVQAAEINFHAEYEIAYMLSKQLGPARDMGVEERTALAFKHYLSAAKWGLREAEFSLGCCYLNGSVPSSISPKQCEVKAIKWIKRAAEQQHDDAKKLLLIENTSNSDAENVDLLFLSSKVNYPAGIKQLIERGAFPNEKRLGTGVTALHVAAFERNFIAVEMLLEAGADINVADSLGRTVLHYAARRDQSDIIRHLFHQGITINHPAQDGRRAINIAALEGHYAAFKVLAEAGADVNVASNSGWAVLHHAARGGHSGIIRYLHQHGVTINRPAQDGRQAIHVAALYGHYEAFEALIKAGADLNARDHYGWTALHHAASGGHPDIIRYLLQRGININHPTKDGRRAIHLAAKCGHFAAFEVLVEVGADINVPSNDGWAPLHHAAQGGDPNIIRYLHRRGISVNHPAEDGRTAIHLAAMLGHYAAFEALIEAGADINLVDNVGRTMLHHAAQGGHSDIMHKLCHQGISVNHPAHDGIRAIHLAAMGGQFTAFRALIGAGADSNVIDNSGKTVLHHAAQGGCADIIRHLCLQGVTLNHSSQDGTRAIHVAAMCGQTAAFEALIEAGADINVVDNLGQTLLHAAAQGGCPDIIRHLLGEGIPINHAAKDKTRAIHQAIFCRQVAAFEALLEAGADVNVVDNLGRAVLHAAAAVGQPKVIRRLLQQGINISPVDHDGWTMLHHAAQGGHSDFIRYLVENGLSVNKEAADRTRPIHIAAAFGHSKAFKVLLELGASLDQDVLIYAKKQPAILRLAKKLLSSEQHKSAAASSSLSADELPRCRLS
jgi:ankyrin repeat protein/TPR repeat protein